MIEKTVNDPAIQDYLNNTKEFDLMRFIISPAGEQSTLLQSNLKALNQYVEKITTSTDSIQASYKNTVQRMQNDRKDDPLTHAQAIATKIPAPINH
ncbi:hypothetical protein [Coxiella-like endosymbiont]|uniref:hypothetical protein n=1 Tax=Coxiella-like endosymbiont TaxID=1592897 RepID=UPI00272D009E|nr:hypothetical protein [Coxiella-like endosymbiont]